MRKKRLMVAFIICLIPVALGLALTAGALIQNKTSLFSPPGFGERLSLFLTTNVAETSDSPRLPELKTPEFDQSADYIFSKIKRYAENQGWEIQAINEDEYTLNAVASTALWGFKDDININVEPDDELSCTLQVRSSSRTGRGDLGKNLDRVIRLIDFLRSNNSSE